jgi:hypothetical protein
MKSRQQLASAIRHHLLLFAVPPVTTPLRRGCRLSALKLTSNERSIRFFVQTGDEELLERRRA